MSNLVPVDTPVLDRELLIIDFVYLNIQGED